MGELEKAFFTFEDDSPELQCLFNPDSIGIKVSNTWTANSAAGQDVKELEFGGRENATMNFTLQFDTTDTGDPVTDYTTALFDKMEIANLPGSNTESNSARPPWVIFHWGKHRSFKAVLESVDVTFEFFSAEGVPLRAKATVALKQFEADEAYVGTNPTSGTPHPHRTHRVQRGETLDRISARYYGDSTRWRMLAAANGIEDPLAIRPGSLIGIPSEDG